MPIIYSFKEIRMENNNLENYLELAKESTTIKKAINEFKYAGWLNENNEFEDDIQKQICLNVLKVLSLINNQNHSNISFSYFYKLLKTLLDGDTLTELTGKQDEWNKIEEDENKILYQNKRVGEIFRKITKKDGSIENYYIDGKVFIDPDGASYTSKNSFVPVTFPCFKPKTKYIKVDWDGNEIEEVKRE